ncbi:unnamed protein product [Lampetra planeri]
MLMNCRTISERSRDFAIAFSMYFTITSSPLLVRSRVFKIFMAENASLGGGRRDRESQDQSNELIQLRKYAYKFVLAENDAQLLQIRFDWFKYGGVLLVTCEHDKLNKFLFKRSQIQLSKPALYIATNSMICS